MARILSARPRLRAAIVSAILFAGTILLFSRALRCGFVNYDDPSYVTDNPQVQGGIGWAGVVWAFTAPTDYWHPLAWLSHMLDSQVYGSAAAGHHLTSMLWHALNAVLAFLVFRRLVGELWLSAFAAALFAWHPLRVESVVWIAERKDVMSGCFFLLTLLAYSRYVDQRKAARRWWPDYLLALTCFAAGLTSKPMLVTLPLVLLILDWWPFARYTSVASLRPALLEKVPFFLLAGVASVVTVLMQQHHGAFVLDLPLGARAGNAVVSYVRYLAKFLWPSDLIVCYPHPGHWPALVVLPALVLLLGISWLAWRQRHMRPWIAAGCLWFLVVLLPVIGLVQVGFQAMADRYTYLALLGIELALFGSIGPPWRSSRMRIGATCAAATVLIALGVRTWNQEGVWRDSVSLFKHAVAVSRDNGTAEDFLASALFADDRIDEAAAHAERACALSPRHGPAFATFAGIRERQGRTAEAVTLYRKALALLPGNATVEMQLGLLERGAGHVEEARRLMTAGLRTKPALRGRTLEIALRALADHDTNSALFLFRLVLAVMPDDAEAHAGMGAILLAQNDPKGALEHLRAATMRDPALTDAQLALARCAEQLGRTDEATAALGRALASGPDNPAVQFRAAEIYARLGDLVTAIRVCRRAVELAPTDSAPHAALGYLLIRTGDRTAGLAEWRRALEIDPNYPGLRDQLQKATREQ